MLFRSEQYRACQSQVAASPEYMKISERVLELPENAKQEDMQKLMADMAKQTDALMLKTCGAQPLSDGQRATRLEEIQRKGAAASGSR